MHWARRGKVRQYEAWAIGAAAGLVDALAMPEPVPRAIPFSMTLYGLAGAVIFGVLRLLLGLVLERRRAIRVALAIEVAAFVFFFAGYRVVTARSGYFASADAAMVGFLLAALAASAAGWFVAWTWRDRQAHRGFRIALAAALLVWPAAAAFEALRGPGEGGRGLVLVSMDAARGDRVSALGYPRPTTPNLDRLVATGLACENALVECPASGPSHATMLTGLPPLAHQVLQNADVLDTAVVTVAERLRTEGFATAAFADNFYIDARFGFGQGFDTFVNEYRASAVSTWSARHLFRTTVACHFVHRLTRDPGQKNTDTLDGALDWLARRPDGDFFLFVHLMDPHAPYDAPPEIRDRFYTPRGERVRDTVELRARLADASPAEIAALKDLYDASIALADRKLGRLLEALDSLGLLEESLVVVTADHGEVLDEDGPVFDHGLPHQGNLHVPLVFGGGLARGREGRVVPPVSTTRWAATAFSVLGLDYPPQGELEGAGPLGDGEARPVFGLTGVTPLDRSYAVEAELKLVLGPDGITGCYDLEADPWERVDLCGATLTEPVRARLDALEIGLLTWLEDTAAAGIVAGRRTDQEFDAATREQLRALGYIE